MAEKLIFVKGEEFIKKIISGERNFFNIELEEGFDLCGHENFNEMQDCLKNGDLKNSPLILNGSKLRNLDADGIYLSFLEAKNVNMKHTALMGADLSKSCFENADMRYVRLSFAKLTDANFKNADFRLADLNMVSLKGALVTVTNF